MDVPLVARAIAELRRRHTLRQGSVLRAQA
jgi:hypothetical protein